MKPEQLQKFYAMAEPRSEEAIRKAEERKMKREQKELLLKDLCARLPYGVKVKVECITANGEKIEDEGVLNSIFINEFGTIYVCVDEIEYELEHLKPYLRPMSSMTEEEKKEYIEYAGYEIEESVNGRHYEYCLKDFCGTPDNPSVNTNGVDWLNKNMFDFHGLIPKGLAIEVTEENNPYKD